MSRIESMTQVTAPCILCVGLSAPPDGSDGTYVHAESARRGLELLKLLQFDLVVVSPGEIGMSIAQFVRQMRVVAPWLKWVLASTATSPPITTQDELAARCNGALAVIDEINGFNELLTLAASVRLRSQRPVPLEA